ncbi:SAM-dependent methyltransferase [Peredibacter sp. HCB2-198]|uniref:SAM-dependent methyltransferase n=1 Tax=Peredibacter sp. HCB2-198 TaxID=3383025 RepID=UPI0038B53F46
MEPTRIVHCEDALVWLRETPSLEGCSLIASMPDISEFPQYTLSQWKEWFQTTAELVMSKTPDDGVAIFFQSDIKVEGTWVDKAFIVQKAAEKIGLELLWHKIFCRAPAGMTTFGRPAYSHMLCFSKNVRADVSKSTADVIPDLGEKTWERGMGLEASLLASKFILKQTNTRTVVHPFCGEGSMMAVANFVGLNAVGIERSPKRAARARLLQVAPDGKSFLQGE